MLVEMVSALEAAGNGIVGSLISFDTMAAGPKRIIFLIRSLHIGGAERQLVNLLNNLDRQKIEPILMTFYSGGELESHLAQDIQLICLNKNGRWDVAGFFKRFLDRLHDLQPAAVYSFLTSANLFAALARLLGPHFVLIWSSRASSVGTSHYGLMAKLELFFQKILSRLPDLVICNSDAAKECRLAEGYSEKKLCVVPNGIDTNIFRISESKRKDFRSEVGLSENDFLIGAAGRIDPMKNFEIFLKAASSHIKSNPQAKFIIVGKGSNDYERKLKHLAEDLGISNAIIWKKEIEMTAFYNAVDLFTLTSEAEGFPNVVAEAMACGRVCVATDVGDVRKILGDFGIRIPPKNPEALAAAWERAAENKWNSSEISKSISERFGLKALADSTSSLILKEVSP